MVKRFGRLLSTGFSSPELGAFAYSVVTLLVTLIGVFRERLLASVIGPGQILDAYVLAHKIPDVLYVTTAALFVSTTLLPYLSREKTEHAKERLLSELYTVQLVGSVVLAGLFIVFNPYVIPLLAPGFAPDTLQMAQNMSAVLMLSPILMGASNLLGLHAQMRKQFIIIALSPLLYNLGTVLTIYWGYEHLGYMALPIGILIAALLHLSTQIIAASKVARLPSVVSVIDWQRVRRIVAQAIPRTLTTAIVPLTSLGMIALASRLSTGSVSMLNFAIVIQNVPVTLIGTSLAVASFPLLVELAAGGDRAGFSKRYVSSLRVMTTLALPITVLLWVLRREIVGVLLSSGNFTAEHASITAGIVGILILGLWAQSIVLLSGRAYYAYEETWKPFQQSLVGMIIALGFAYGAAHLFGNSIVTIASAFVIGWWVAALVAIGRTLHIYCYKVDVRHMVRGMAGSILASGVVLVVALLVRDLAAGWVVGGEFTTIIAQSFVVGVTATLAGIGTLTLIGDEEARMFLGFLRRRFPIFSFLLRKK